MWARLKLFFSLERYAFLILFLEVIAFLLEFFIWQYLKYWSLFYTILHSIAAFYWGYKMIKLFREWPRKERYHNAIVNYFNFCQEKGLPLKKSKLYMMNSPCDRITRNEICKNLNITL